MRTVRPRLFPSPAWLLLCTAAISTQAAAEIARTAQHHGQEDDITVLTLAFAPAEVAHA